jgi:hypothetical protein
MKVQEAIFRAMAKKITWWQAAEILGISDRHLRRFRDCHEELGYRSVSLSLCRAYHRVVTSTSQSRPYTTVAPLGSERLAAATSIERRLPDGPTTIGGRPHEC